MSNASDDAFIRHMLNVPDEFKAQYFYSNHHRIKDDATYWNVLGTLWKMGGTVVQQDLWLDLFNSKRKRRHKLMKGRERKRWRNLPNTFTAYRAVNNDEEINTAMAWTLSLAVAEKFAGKRKRKIVSKEFNKKDCFAFFDRRHEEEVLINQPKSGG